MTTDYRKTLIERAEAASAPHEHKALDNIQHRNLQALRKYHQRRAGIKPRRRTWIDRLKTTFGTALSSRRR